MNIDDFYCIPNEYAKADSENLILSLEEQKKPKRYLDKEMEEIASKLD